MKYYKEYKAWLDELSGPIQIGSIQFNASRILEELDSIAFRCGYDDYLNAEGLTEEAEEKEDNICM